MTKYYALELWISTELATENQRIILQGRNENIQGKCIPSACESVYRQIALKTVKARGNARNNTQHCWAQQCCLLLRDVSRCVQMLARSHNMLGL